MGGVAFTQNKHDREEFFPSLAEKLVSYIVDTVD